MSWGEERSEQEPKQGSLFPSLLCTHLHISVRVQNVALGGFQ